MYRRFLTITFAAAATLAFASCASGSAIVTGTRRPPIQPAQVTLYLEPPADFEIIGLVSASSDAGLTEQGSVDYAVRELRKQAARLGANGVLILATGDKQGTTVITQGSGTVMAVPTSGKSVQGRAIFVKTP